MTTETKTLEPLVIELPGVREESKAAFELALLLGFEKSAEERLQRIRLRLAEIREGQ